MVLFPHQQTMEDALFLKLETLKSVLAQLATGGGKTVVMASFIARYIKENPDDIVLVSVHRDELIGQTSKTLARFGILNETITSEKKFERSLFSNVYVGMTQTIHARKLDLPVKLLVVDEAHERVHIKTFDFFPQAKLVGFTATPVINIQRTYYKCNYCDEVFDFQETCCYNEQIEKWRASVTMSEQYEDIVCGPPISWLIANGFLVDEIVFSYNYYSSVKDIDDEEEIAIESAKHDDQVLAEYLEKAQGKRTMIFTASTKQNISLVKTFSTAGINIRSYDSVHNKKGDRKNVVDWFDEIPDGVLVSTGTFTTGFDNREVECVMVNRPTKSLSLWHQMIGRGGRTSEKIYKEHVIVIDLGGNVSRFGKWSDDVDWRNIFFFGLSKAKRKKETLLQCDKCAYNWIGVIGDTCPDCGHTNINQNPTILRNGKEVELAKMSIMTQAEQPIPLPNPAKIADYVNRIEGTKGDYFRIIIGKYVDLWKLNRVSRSIYVQRIENGSLEPKIQAYIDRMYGSHGKIKDGALRTKRWLMGKIKDKLEAAYKL